jgi:hypothetical protein
MAEESAGKRGLSQAELKAREAALAQRRIEDAKRRAEAEAQRAKH